MKKVYFSFFFTLLSFSVYAQFKGGSGGGSTKGEIRTQTVLSVENSEEKVFFENLKIISQTNTILIKWNETLGIEQIEIIDILGNTQKTVEISEFQKQTLIYFESAKGVYFIRFKNNREQLFTRKIIY